MDIADRWWDVAWPQFEKYARPGSEVQAHRAEINKIKGEFGHVSQQMAVLDATGLGQK